MSQDAKLRAGDSEMTKLKELWKKASFADSRPYWLEQLSSSRSQPELRAEILKKLKVNLQHNSQLSKFKTFAEGQEQRELMAQKIEERKKELLAGGMSLEEAQDVLLTEAAAYSTAARDFKLGLKTSAEISKARSTTLDRDKFQFDATREAMAKLDSLKAIKTNSKLTEAQKLEQARLELFGVAPK